MARCKDVYVGFEIKWNEIHVCTEGEHTLQLSLLKYINRSTRGKIISKILNPV